VHAVTGRVHHHRGGEEPEQPDLGDGAGQRDPLAGAQRDGGQRQRGPDEPERYQHPPAAPQRHHQLVQDGDGGDGQRATHPDRGLDEVDQRDQGAGVAAEGQPRPDVGPALVGEGGAELGDDHPGGREEQRGHDRQPGDGLRPAASDHAEGIHDHDGGDQQADRVQPPQLPPQLGPLHP
jgi:hypothetical protein